MMRPPRWLLAAAVFGAAPVAAAVVCPAEVDRLPGFSGEIALPLAERAFTTAESGDEPAFREFLEVNAGLVVYLELDVRRADAPEEPACIGNLVAVEEGEILLRLPAGLVVVEDLARGAPFASCQPDFDGFRLRGFFFLEPPPPVASLPTYRLVPTVVGALLANRSILCLRRQRS